MQPPPFNKERNLVESKEAKDQLNADYEAFKVFQNIATDENILKDLKCLQNSHMQNLGNKLSTLHGVSEIRDGEDL